MLFSRVSYTTNFADGRSRARTNNLMRRTFSATHKIIFLAPLELKKAGEKICHRLEGHKKEPPAVQKPLKAEVLVTAGNNLMADEQA